jgi:hypothetical protein
LALIGLSALVIDSGCRPGGQLLQPSGQQFELLICTEFVQAVNADLNRLGVAVGDTVDVFDVTHDRLRSNEAGISERPEVLRNATPFPNKANRQRRRWFHSSLRGEEPHVRRAMREHVLLFCLLGLVLTATIILVTAPGAVTWALSLVE